MEQFSSKLLENAIQSFQGLPGVGRKTATRMVLHMLKWDLNQVAHLSEAIFKLKSEIKYCVRCHNLSDEELCQICSDAKRDTSTICVVEDIRDVLAIENTMQYKGLYHVLGGKISPMDGIGPSDLQIESLIHKCTHEECLEIILALSTTIEGDTTNFYIYKKIQQFPIKITTIARGISVGDELEYADEVTLGRSILHRMPYETSIKI